MMKDPYPRTRELRNALLRHRYQSHGWGCNTEASQEADRRVAERKEGAARPRRGARRCGSA